MQRKYIIDKAENRRLVIFFTGWSTDWNIVYEVNLPEGYDFICCYDYRDLVWDKLRKGYKECVIIAWSFGIPAAEFLYPEISKELNVTGLYAINGSRLPVDDEKGIPRKIFEGTLNNLDERNLKKFRIRMSGSTSSFKEMEGKLTSDRSIDSLKEELLATTRHQTRDSGLVLWDYALISRGDNIFPAENLIRAWVDTPFSIMEEASHLPDFGKLFNLFIKNKESIGKNFEKSLSTYDDSACVQKGVADKIAAKLISYNSKFENVLEIGCGSGFLSRIIERELHPGKFILMDLTGIPPSGLKKGEFIHGDVEVELSQFKDDFFNLIVSASTLQWVHSPTRVLKQIHRILRREGICAISVFIDGTYKELTALTGETLLYHTGSQWKQLAIRCGFEIIDSIQEISKAGFGNVAEVFGHIKTTGVNSHSGKNKSVGELRKIMEDFPIEDGEYKLTYNTLTLILKKTV